MRIKLPNGVYTNLNKISSMKPKERLPMSENKGVLGVVVVVLACIIVGATLFFGLPMYNIWTNEQAGKAELARAEQNRQIAVQEAKAKLDSAKLLAEAEVERAKGLAEANKIVADSLTGKSEYIHYLWIEALKDSKDQIIYIPTEAGIPVTESTRLLKLPEPKQTEE